MGWVRSLSHRLHRYNLRAMADVRLDCRGLNCPMPIVRISQQMRKMEVGQTIEVEADDPAFGADVKAWTAKMKQELVELSGETIQRAVIKKVS